jgi:hypothetical protein
MGFYTFLGPKEPLSLKKVSEVRGGSVDPSETWTQKPSCIYINNLTRLTAAVHDVIASESTAQDIRKENT